MYSRVFIFNIDINLCHIQQLSRDRTGLINVTQLGPWISCLNACTCFADLY